MVGRSNRPRIKVTRGFWGWLGELVTLLAFGVILAVILANWGRINADLFFYPIVAIIAALAITILCRFPHIFSYPVIITPENAPRLYRIAVATMVWNKAVAVILAAYGFWLFVQAETLNEINKFRWVILICAVFILSIFFYGRLRMKQLA
jgi:hypothetical protein